MVAITHMKLVQKDACTTTSGTEEEIGTVTTLNETKDIMAFFAQFANTSVRTTAEGVAPEMVINPKAVLPQQIRFMSGDSDGGAPATNINNTVNYGKLLPVAPTQTSLGGQEITAKADLAYEATGDNAGTFGVLYATDTYDPMILRNKGIGIGSIDSRIRFTETMTLLDNSGVVAKAFPESIKIPGWVTEVVAIGLRCEPDAVMTAGEVFMSYVELSGTLGNMYPQEYPFPAIGASLGVPVGNGQMIREMIMPVYWKLPNETITIDGTYHALQANTGDVPVHVTLYCR